MFEKLIVIGLLLLSLSGLSQKPNIIYIMTDDMGYGDLSCYGQKKYQTPNLDRLASEGVKLVNAYSAGAVCTPTRTALMTGRYPARTPVGLLEPIKNVKKDSLYGLTSDYTSLPSLLKAGGYETVLIGKWHLGFLRYSDNGGLSKSNGSLWEGGIKVPAFVRWTGKLAAGEVNQQVAVTMDWTATILAVADLKPDARFPLDGINLMPVLSGYQPPIERELYWRTSQRINQHALRFGKWKYLRDDNGEYLFEIETDHLEKHNLKTQEPDIFNQLKTKFNNWEKQVLKPISL